MNIFLVGFMGCGKSSLGKRLALRLNYRFLDLDEEIERQAGLSISEIFKRDGEHYFRQLEANILRQVEKSVPTVVATGGGTPCHFDNMDYINSNGVSVFLRMSPKSLAWRLENTHKNRPLIANMQGEGLLQFVETKLAEREQFYMQAHCIVKGETVKVAHVVALVFGS